MLVCPTWGAMTCGCALHFGHILDRKSSNTLKKQQTPKGAGAKHPPPWGAAEGGAIAILFNVLLDFLSKMWPKCRAHSHFMAPHVGHTSICYNFLLDVITFPACP